MKRLPSALLCLSMISPCPAHSGDGTRLTVTRAQADTAALIADIVAKDHYETLSLDDSLSERILASYLASLDPYKDVFLKADVEAFSKFAHALDDGLIEGDIAPAFQIFAVFHARLEERTSFAERFLEGEPTFDAERRSRGDLDWAVSRAELDRRWRARLSREAGRLSSRGAQDVVQSLSVRYQQLARRYRALSSDEVFRHFIDAYLDTLDPHTGYFLPRRRAAQRTGPGNGSLQGIGVQLRSRREHVVIKRIFEGGPADHSRQLHVGDRILAVAQGPGEFTDVVAWTLNDVVDLIRGPAGTEVRLQILPKGMSQERSPGTLALRRGKIELKEVRVKGSIEVSERNGKLFRIAVIDVPSFYIDYAAYGRGATQYTSTTQHVERFLRSPEHERIDGLLIDLRGNRGGALIEAVRLAGLFIATGPIVQVRDNAGSVTVHRDTDPRVVYAGPLAVIVDRYSASASEIFAGAMQDYRRGIVLGERSYGKGTVQQTLDLNSVPNTGRHTIGQLVLTIAKYFRVTGESTQLHGIMPDVPLPPVYAATEYGESIEDNALDWERVPAVEFEPEGFNLVGREPVARRREHQTGFGGSDGADAFKAHEHRRAAVLAEGIDMLVEALQTAEDRAGTSEKQ